MISKFAEKLVDCLYCQHDISDDEQELYKYGFFVLLSQILYLIIAIILGSIFKSVFESVIFYIAFQFIRRYAGGYHAKTETRCEILSTLSILCCIVLIKLSKMYDIRIALLSISLVFAVLIFILCPLDTPEKPLNDKEYKSFTNIGIRPTWRLTSPLSETHIFDFNQDIYDKIIDVELIDFIRDEIKFSSKEAFLKQILKDTEYAKMICVQLNLF